MKKTLLTLLVLACVPLIANANTSMDIDKDIPNNVQMQENFAPNKDFTQEKPPVNLFEQQTSPQGNEMFEKEQGKPNTRPKFGPFGKGKNNSQNDKNADFQQIKPSIPNNINNVEQPQFYDKNGKQLPPKGGYPVQPPKNTQYHGQPYHHPVNHGQPPRHYKYHGPHHPHHAHYAHPPRHPQYHGPKSHHVVPHKPHHVSPSRPPQAAPHKPHHAGSSRPPQAAPHKAPQMKHKR